MRYYPHGLGGESGSDISNSNQAFTSRAVVYVHHTGVAGNAGLTRARPYASLSAAIAGAAGDGQVFVMMSGHTDSSSGTTGYGGMIFCGEGEGASSPTFIGGSLSITQPGILLENLRFTGGAYVDSVSTNNSGFTAKDCYFQASAGTSALKFDSNTISYCSVQGCTFEQNSSTGNAPALYMTSANGVGFVTDCTFKTNDTIGAVDQWATYAAVLGCGWTRGVGLKIGDGCGVKITGDFQILDSSSQRGGWYET
jgi:hypothetical protein